MKTIITIVLLLALSACNRTENIGVVKTTQDGLEYRIILIENCEYIVFETECRACNNYAISVTHKGNCGNNRH